MEMKKGKANVPPMMRGQYKRQQQMAQMREQMVEAQTAGSDGLPVFNLFVRTKKQNVSSVASFSSKHKRIQGIQKKDPKMKINSAPQISIPLFSEDCFVIETTDTCTIIVILHFALQCSHINPVSPSFSPFKLMIFQMWYPCGSFKGDDRSAALAKSYADGGMLSGISKKQLDGGIAGSLFRDLPKLKETVVRAYPQLRKSRDDFEFGYKLAYEGLSDEQSKEIIPVEPKEQSGPLDGLRNIFS